MNKIFSINNYLTLGFWGIADGQAPLDKLFDFNLIKNKKILIKCIKWFNYFNNTETGHASKLFNFYENTNGWDFHITNDNATGARIKIPDFFMDQFPTPATPTTSTDKGLKVIINNVLTELWPNMNLPLNSELNNLNIISAANISSLDIYAAQQYLSYNTKSGSDPTIMLIMQVCIIPQNNPGLIGDIIGSK